MPHTQEGSLYEVGGAEIWRIAETGYLSDTPKKTSKDWPSEWFYMEDVPLPDPVRQGLPEFNNAPLKKCRSWRPRSPQEEDNREVLYLMNRIKALAQSGLTVIEVMSICIMRGVQPLQYRGHPGGVLMGNTMPPLAGVRVRTTLSLKQKFCPNCSRER